MSEDGSGYQRLNLSALLLLRQNRWVAFALVIAAALLLTLTGLGHDLCKGNEAVEAVFIQQMVEHHQLLFPRSNGQSPMYKPPLFHWSAAALDKILGITKVTAFNFRLPAALYTTGTIALTMGFTYSVLGAEGSVLAGLTLLGEHDFIRRGRQGRVDMTLTFFEVLALFAFLWWLDARGRPRGGAMLYLLALALGLAVLAKGPVGAIVPGLSMLIFLAAEERLGEALRRLRPLPILLAIAIGSSWYLVCYLNAKHDFLTRQIVSENFGRFFGSLGNAPPWFYLAPLLLGSLPFSLLVPFAVYDALFGTHQPPKEREPASRSPAAERGGLAVIGNGHSDGASARDATRLMAIFWLVTLAFFSIAAYKSRWYILPQSPASAVLLAWLAMRTGARLGHRAIEGSFAAGCVALAAANLIFIPLQERTECRRYSYRQTAAEITRRVDPDEPLYSSGFIDEDFAPLLFYLDRNAPFISGDLADAPAGYIIVPAKLWDAQKDHAEGCEVVFVSSEGRRKPVLLRHRLVPRFARDDSGLPGRKTHSAESS